MPFIQSFTFALLAIVRGDLGNLTTRTNSANVSSYKPFTGFHGDFTFVEQFDSRSVLGNRWVTSEAQKDGDGDEELLQYRGEWEVEMPIDSASSISGDFGLVMKTPAAHHGISAQLPQKFSLKDSKLFTLQYEVNLQEGLECGGAYLKLVSAESKVDQEALTDRVPYSIMFGPDRCGLTNKVHFIIQFTNPVTKETHQHELKKPPTMHVARQVVLYTLRIYPETDDFEILVDDQLRIKGNLKTDMDPPVSPPEMIPDANAKKPESWHDAPKIVDELATKPADWVDEETIPDVDAVKPEGWIDNDVVPDPNDKMPSDWNAPKQGKWVQGVMRNPACSHAPGCGEWKRPSKANPAYKGKWEPPMIDNPNYKGPWIAPEIPNPAYFKVDEIAKNLKPMSMIFFELWTIQPNILFDNILISTMQTQESIDAFTAATFGVKDRLQKAAREDRKIKFGDVRVDAAEQFTAEGLAVFSEMLMVDPVKAVKNFPILFGISLLAMFGVPLVLFTFTRDRPGKIPTTTTKVAPKLRRKDSMEPQAKPEDEEKDEDNGVLYRRTKSADEGEKETQ